MNNRMIIKFSDVKNIGLYLAMLGISFISTIATLFDFSKPAGYSLLFFLPLSYLILLLSTKNVWSEIPQNIGVTILVFLEFVRLVVSPLLLVLANYPENITRNTADNTPWAILLMVYETFAVIFVLNRGTSIRVNEYEPIDNRRSVKRMDYIMILVIFLTIGMIALVPEILSNYRSITGLFSDVNYTNSEQTFLVSEYGTTTAKKFLLATANYILIVVRLLIPAYVIGVVNIKKYPLRRVITPLMIITPFLFVAGAIARSLYYALFLIIFYFTLKGIDLRKLDKPILLAIGFVFAFFIVRFSLTSNGQNYWAMLSGSFTSYFSGLNIVSGTFNLPRNITTQLYYFVRDILGSFPYSTTIFRYDGLTIANFFNSINGSRGQIPTTIGLGYYYFTPIFAPLYTVFFTHVAKTYGRKALLVNNQYYKLVYTYLSFIAALGIGMYNIEIVLGAMIRVVFPIYLIVRFAYRKTGSSFNE